MILVTGGTGFVGRQVVRSLVEAHLPVRVVVRQEAAAAKREPAGVEAIACRDIFRTGPEWWRDTLAGVDTVIHLAWYAEPGMYLKSPENLACLTGSIDIARACIAAGVRRFVGVGSCAEYDLSDAPVGPDTPLKPQTLYAACKASLFCVLSQLFPEAEVDFAWCRLFYLHGEGEDPRRLVPYLHRQLSAGAPAELTSGDQVRDFLDVREAGAMIARVATGGLCGPVNICSGIPVSVRDLAEGVADRYGRRDLLRFGARPENAFDPPRVVGVPSDIPS